MKRLKTKKKLKRKPLGARFKVREPNLRWKRSDYKGATRRPTKRRTGETARTRRII
jgi:hypothetical protein